jgi:hypothetical protein
VQKIVNVQNFEIVLKSLIKYKYNNHLYHLDSMELARKYNIFIGKDRVLSSDIVGKMMNMDVNSEINNRKCVLQTPINLKSSFLKKNDSLPLKEQLAKCYLQASSFIDSVQECLK